MEPAGGLGDEVTRLCLFHPQGQQTEGVQGQQLLGFRLQCRPRVGVIVVGDVGGLLGLFPMAKTHRKAEILHPQPAES